MNDFDKDDSGKISLADFTEISRSLVSLWKSSTSLLTHSPAFTHKLKIVLPSYTCQLHMAKDESHYFLPVSVHTPYLQWRNIRETMIDNKLPLNKNCYIISHSVDSDRLGAEERPKRRDTQSFSTLWRGQNRYIQHTQRTFWYLLKSLINYFSLVFVRHNNVLHSFYRGAPL